MKNTTEMAFTWPQLLESRFLRAPRFAQGKSCNYSNMPSIPASSTEVFNWL